MRNFRAWIFLLAMLLCVLTFSGCGGSSSSVSSSEEEETTDAVSQILAGTWVYDSSDGYYGYATNAESTSNRVTLRYSSGMKMVFSDFDFNSSAAAAASDIEGSVNLFYVHSCAVFDNNDGQIGAFTIKSYSSSSDTDKTKQMTIRRVDDNEWILTPASGSSTIPTVTINLDSKNSKISVQWQGSAYISALAGTYNYHINCSFVKTSNQAIYDDDDSEGGDDDESRSIAEILKGTWLLSTEDSASATNINTGESLTLQMSTGNKISFFNFSDITDSGTGSADVFYSQNWLAVNGSSVVTGSFSIKSYFDYQVGDRTQEMTLVKVSDTEWRLEGKTGNSETLTLNLTLVSNNEISTQWSGIVYNSKLRGYYNCNIQCSFRKSSDTPTSDDVTVPSDETTEEILEKTWGVSTENNAIDVEFELNSGTMLLISSDVDFSHVDVTGDSGTAILTFNQAWRIFWTDPDLVSHLEYTSLNLQDKEINMTRSGINKWRCEFAEGGNDTAESMIMRGTVFNVEITSDSSLHIIHDGIVKLDSETGTTYFILYDQNELDYWAK